jgi:hypothetical protein
MPPVHSKPANPATIATDGRQLVQTNLALNVYLSMRYAEPPTPQVMKEAVRSRQNMPPDYKCCGCALAHSDIV